MASVIFDLIGRDLASKAFDAVGRSAEKLGRDVEKSNKSLGMAIGGIGKMAGAAGVAVAGLGGLAVGLSKIGDEAVGLSLSVGKARLLFGKDFGAMDQWAGTLSKRLGITRIEGLRLAGGFANLARQTGFSARQTVGLSQQYVELIQRVQLMSDGQFDQAGAAEALAAAFRGEYDALQRVVPTISQASIDQNALTIKKREGTRVTEDQARALAVLNLVQRGTVAGAALMETAEGKQALAIANTKAKIREQWQAIEMQLLPSIASLWDQVDNKVVPALQNFANELGSEEGQQKIRQYTADLNSLISSMAWIIENTPKILGARSTSGMFDNLSKDTINKLGGIVPNSGDHRDDDREGRRASGGGLSVPGAPSFTPNPSGRKLGGGGGASDIVNMGIRIGAAHGRGIAFGIRGKASVIQAAIQSVMDKAKDTYQKQLDKLNDLKGKRSDLASQVSEGIKSAGGSAITGRGGGGLLGRLGQAARNAGSFYGALKRLRQMKVSGPLLQAIAEAGPVDGLQAAREIIAAGSAASFNKQQSMIDKYGAAAGGFVGDSVYGAAIKKQQGAVDKAKAGLFGATIIDNRVNITIPKGYVGTPQQLAQLIKDALKQSGNAGQRVTLK